MARRQNFSAPVAREIAERARNAIGEPACEWCGAVGVPLDLHHLKMDAMVPSDQKKRKPLTAKDGVFICRPCHLPETARQRDQLAKVERQEGIYWRPRKPPTFHSRNTFPGPAPKDRTVTKIAPRRPLFVSEDA